MAAPNPIAAITIPATAPIPFNPSRPPTSLTAAFDVAAAVPVALPALDPVADAELALAKSDS